MKTPLLLRSATAILSAGALFLSAQEDTTRKTQATATPTTATAQKKPAGKRKEGKPLKRGGHFLPPSERHLDELITRIRSAQESGQTYKGRRALTEAERERRFKVEGGGANFRDGVAGAESEYAIAVDPTGQNVVVGYNLFAADPNGVSGMGVAYSTDGGQTFTDGGFLPSPGGQLAPDGTPLPQVLSDPDVKWVPGGSGCNFVYSSISQFAYAPSGTITSSVDSLGIHRSRDCGKTWEGPFEVPPASNPNGLTSRGAPVDGADKEFMDVNLETGRVMISWTNFTSSRFNADGVELSVTYSDDVMTGNPPTWSKRAILNKSGDGFTTGSMPRFGPAGTQDAYVAYSVTLEDGSASNIAVAASHDGGATWETSVLTAKDWFGTMDDVLGNDRTHEFPALAVDRSNGPNRGAVFVTYADNDNNDGADIAVQKSTDGGKTWTPIRFVNANPGKDRAQWFPYITCDATTGRVSIIFYDQSYQTSGDLTQVLMTFSDDGGNTWSAPAPLTARPFHAAYGNDSSAPNLGDYIGASSVNGTLYAVWAGTPNVVNFTDGQPATYMSVPTLFFKTYTGPSSPAVDLGSITITGTASDGYLHAGDTLTVNVALRNPVTNSAVSAAPLTGVSASLSSTTPGVSIAAGRSTYPDLAPGAAAPSASPYQVTLSSDFAPGTPIEFALDVTSASGTTRRLFTQQTGAPQGTVLLQEDFESVPSGSTLPAGWTTSHAAGNNTVPWTTNRTFCGATSNGLFHIDAEDGRTITNNYRWERAFSPTFSVPADAQWVTIDLDICYDTEDDVSFPVLAYDGAFLRVTDQTTGHTIRSVYADAFAETLNVGNLLGYPKHLADDRTASYFGDTSAWAGDSGGVKHVTIRVPGMAGSTGQLRFEYTQDAYGTCKDVRPDRTVCGVLIDNIVVRSVKSN